jgi:ferric-dicitrate binding protein FerR (iron transport regulator)
MKLLAGLLAAGILMGTPAFAQTHHRAQMQAAPQTHQVWISELDDGQRITLDPNSLVTIRLSEPGSSKWTVVSTTGDVVDLVQLDHAAALSGSAATGTAVAQFSPAWVGESTLKFALKDTSGKTIKTFTITFTLPVGTPGTEE